MYEHRVAFADLDLVKISTFESLNFNKKIGQLSSFVGILRVEGQVR